MSSLFSGGGSIDIPAGRRSGRERGKFGRMAGSIIQALGGLSSTPGLTIEPRGLTREERKDPNATGVIYNRERGSKGAEAVNYSPRTKEKDEMERIMKEKAEKKGGRKFSDTTAFSINKGGRVGSKKSIFGGLAEMPIYAGGSSPIPGVGGHEYLNNPKYAEHRREYYGKKKRVDKFGNPITKPEEDVKGKGRRRRAERDRIRKVRKSRGRRVGEKKNLSEFDLTPRRPKFGKELIPPDNYDGKVGRPPVPMSKEDYDQINRRKRTGNMEDTNHPFRMFK